ncbi:MAG: hypothetical protein QOE92_1282 [Chloroflexota bacterium]|jgi:hypothetical protein|nr:hypothetical protein [Chloroflexota bacterium]
MAVREFSPAATPPLEPGETVVAEATGVLLGWQPQTILIWWVPGAVFIILGWLEFRSVVVTVGLALFCVALFLFYARDREVRPRAGRKRYVLTDRRLLVGSPGPETAWRPLPLGDIGATRMEHGVADRVVAVLSSAATIVLELRAPGPRGEPRRLRIGPMRRPRGFQAAIDGLLADGDRQRDLQQPPTAEVDLGH